MNRIGVLIVAMSLVVPVAVPADQVSCELAKRIGSDVGPGDLFGCCVSISGNVALVGARDDDDNGSNAGAVYVYRHDGSDWVEETKLTASDGAAGDFLGSPNFLAGNIALIGARQDDDNGSNSGSAYIFRYDGIDWVEETKLTASDGAANDYFGSFVSLFGDVAVIGAPLDDDNGTDSGSAYIFRHDGSGWVEEAKLIASDGAQGDGFGVVSISGNVVIVGARLDDDNGTDSGSSYVFRNNGSGWVEEAKLIASDGVPGDQFGGGSLSGNTALFGVARDDDNGTDSGSAYVFRYNGSNWVEEAKLTASDGEPGDHFAHSVSLASDTALIGVRYDGDNGSEAGAAFVFRYDGSGWTEDVKLTASDGSANDRLGTSVSISGDIALVAARDDQDSGPWSGSVYFFGLSDEVCPNYIDVELTCVPSFGTLPFDTMVTVTLTNIYADQVRRIAGHVDVTLANGEHYSNYRAGYTNVHPGESNVFAWPQTLLDGSFIGTTVAVLVAEDVTPSPYNQPPYPPAGDTDTDTCTVTGIAP